MKKLLSIFAVLQFVFLIGCHSSGRKEQVKMLCYSAFPTPYFNDHAKDVAEIYDGFYFVAGSWDEGVVDKLGVDGAAPKNSEWQDMLRQNLAALNKAGVTENLLGVSFGGSGEWPSPETLLSDEYTSKMAKHFAALGKAAKELGFRGVSIDTEYPYPRYEIDHEIYTYDGYTAEDLMTAAKKQGRAVMSALLDEFPQAVVFNLPGVLRCRPLERQFLLGLLAVMAERQAPGGFHLGSEYTYGMRDHVTDIASCRFEDAAIPLLVDDATAAYWKEKCSIAPGVWPLHMVETGSPHYPVQSWKKEIAELRLQMSILRATTKRYIWSYSGHPVWYVHSKKIEKKYGLKKQGFPRKDIDIRAWQKILRDKPVLRDQKLLRLVQNVRQFDAGALTPERFCQAFGSPARWWVLGMLSNPNTQPKFAAAGAVLEPIDTYTSHFGRDQVVRWFAYDVMDPRGVVGLKYLFDWQNTDSSSAHLVSFIHSTKKQEAFLHVGWDDGIIIYLDDDIVFDERNYPKRGKGLLYRDRYQFEKRVPITLKKGKTRLSVTSINSHGNWLFSLRITDKNDMPLRNVTSSLN